MTNADKVRSMTDEELAWIIGCPENVEEELCGKADEPGCLECCKKWLESDVTDEDVE